MACDATDAPTPIVTAARARFVSAFAAALDISPRRASSSAEAIRGVSRVRDSFVWVNSVTAVPARPHARARIAREATHDASPVGLDGGESVGTPGKVCGGTFSRHERARGGVSVLHVRASRNERRARAARARRRRGTNARRRGTNARGWWVRRGERRWGGVMRASNETRVM